ncbi:nucleotide-binding universal stress UspA family protein [Sphingobacterium allocomposti]|jgi:nucleotide-binding universal stress UspA family protein|uniref:Nucleotide-binding universal stress UspA family protein n=1 Tax=Sphingobacterium allocomposti TaxID=415956 RepID=A0A5S5DIA6_9SPHI|nr:universal stress protein [Sphingobacterium composti Yoo et al. 2007 non Ten et al. 2007]TYP95713.1 nucleotide-binding universal stress UspA family protein [Sphingobacterium composti Yoo et al. 2007 non Ten et al. 2007]HLS96603.1 universal stress protein [Sphingobacterium sp.]
MSNHRFNRILLAVDDTPCTEKAIAYAKDLVREFGSSLAVVTVIPPTSPASYGADPLLGQQPIIVAEVSEIQQEAAQRYLEEIGSEFAGAQEVFLFNKVGNVRDEILNTAAEWTADLIIMGSNGRTGFEHFISGSVSESVIRKASCPVLVVPGKCD